MATQFKTAVVSAHLITKISTLPQQIITTISYWQQQKQIIVVE